LHADGRVFVGPTGAIPRRTNFQATWRKEVDAAGYQHASRDRERAIAAAVSARVEAARPKAVRHDRGTATETAPNRASGQRTRKRP